MKLQFPFIQLPLHFDAPALMAELATVDESQWRPHPQGFPGNSALPLIAVDGDPDNDGLIGPMQPTPLLALFPYLNQVLGSLGAVLGRTRLMRLSGQAEVTKHIDQAYYWAERMRVHVPIVTQPGVRFFCGDAVINMQAGECWIFDTWRLHSVVNQGDETRIHLVADTVGGEAFWEHMTRSRPHHMQPPGWQPRHAPFDRNAGAPTLQFEAVNAPLVMSPWELHSHLAFLFGELAPQQSGVQDAQVAAMRFMRRWQSLWARWGASVEGQSEFRRLLDAFIGEMNAFRGRFRLRNEIDFFLAAKNMVFNAAVNDATAQVTVGEPRDAPETRPGQIKRDAEFDRPVFIVSPPRSGSTLLFETLAQAANAFTIGDESHALIEGMNALHPSVRGFESNRLDAGAAGSDIAANLRLRFREALIDRHKKPPSVFPVRMLEKTPKNSLRIPFLSRVFPEAHFIYLYRDVRSVLASMIEAWLSGRFRTYPRLPGWNGPDWSLALTPGWRDLNGKPLHEIVAAQWQATTNILLDDLAAVAGDRVHVARYDALVADPASEVARLCAAVDFVWDRPLDANLPLARYTVSQPDPDKWKRHQAEIEALLPQLAGTIARAEQLAKR